MLWSLNLLRSLPPTISPTAPGIRCNRNWGRERSSGWAGWLFDLQCWNPYFDNAIKTWNSQSVSDLGMATKQNSSISIGEPHIGRVRKSEWHSGEPDRIVLGISNYEYYIYLTQTARNRPLRRCFCHARPLGGGAWKSRLDMFRRTLSKDAARQLLDRIGNRLTKMLAELRRIDPAG
jgi:hypothetical protein